MNSFDEPASSEEAFEELTIADVFSSDSEDPATKAARKLDWEAFTATLTERAKAVIEMLVEGGRIREVAVRFGVSDSTMQNTKNQLKAKMIEFFGVDILAEIARLPAWKDNLVASRESLACRVERMAG